MVIVDDEPPARAKLRRFINELDDFQVVTEADAVETAVAAITELTPDVLYLDVQLGTHSGFEVLDALGGTAVPVIVFTTAYSKHAVRAFEAHAGGKVHLIREPLSSFISQLAPEEFLRVHRSHVARIGFIAEMRSMFHGDYELILLDGERLPLSRRYKQLLPATIRERL
ncbi:MAG: LytR/AlgR family response regulator transcription factor [Steroidobacteraceae bacterium]